MQNKTFEGIKENKLFTWIDPDFLKSIRFDQKQIFFYEEGRVIYRINDESSLLYLVVEGEVKIRYYNYRSPAGIEVIKIKNDFFGEKELIFKSPRISAASAKTNCLLYGLNITDLPKHLIRKLYYANNGLFPEHEIPERKKISEPHEKSDYTDARFKRIEAPGKMNYYRELETVSGMNSSWLKEKYFSAEKNINQKVFLNESPELHGLAGLSSLLPDEPGSEEVPDLKEINDFNYKFLPHDLKNLIKKLAQAVNAIYTSGNKHDTLLRESAELMNCERCFLLKVDNINNEMIRSDGFRFKIGLGITGMAAERKTIFFTNNAECDPRFIPEYESEPGVKINSLLCLPLNGRGIQISAVLQFINRKEDFTDKDKYFLEAASAFLLPFTENDASSEKERNIFSCGFAQSIGSRLEGNIKTIKNLVDTLYKFNPGLQARRTAGSIYRQAELAGLFPMIMKEAVGEEIPYRFDVKDFSFLMENLLQTLADYAYSKNIILLKKNRAKGHVFVDKQKFRLACFNLLSLWCPSLPDGGKVFISTENAESRIRIEFKTTINFTSRDTDPEISWIENLISGLAITEKIISRFGGSVEKSFLYEEQKIIIYLPLIEDRSV